MQLKTVEIVYRSQIELFHSNKAAGGTREERRCFFVQRCLLQTVESTEPGARQIPAVSSAFQCQKGSGIVLFQHKKQRKQLGTDKKKSRLISHYF